MPLVTKTPQSKVQIAPLYTLMPHQEECVTKLGPRVASALIGDDMGMGKTIEAIERDLRIRFWYTDKGLALPGPTLIVCPLSAVSVWVNHYEKFVPKMRVIAIDPKDRDALVADRKKHKHDVYIVHWQALALLEKNDDWKRFLWLHIIADEAHRINNRKTQQTRALKRLRTTYKTAMSGTLAKTADGFWSVLNWADSKTWSSYWRYVNTYCNVTTDIHGYRKVEGPNPRTLSKLHKVIAPIYVRRTKEGMTPGKYYNTIWIDLNSEQRRAYDEMRKNMIAWVGQNKDEPVIAAAVISRLVRLQQFTSAYAKIVEVKKNVRCKEVGHGCSGWHEKLVRAVQLDEPSVKLDCAMELLSDHDSEQFVFFSQSRQLCNLFAARLRRHDISHVLYTGDTSGDRDEGVRLFQKGQLRCFVGTIGAGSESITLDAAHIEVFLDRSWDHTQNRQAEDRCDRVTQRKAVQVYDLVARNTIELGRNQRVRQKWDWVEAILGDKTLDIQKGAVL